MQEALGPYRSHESQAAGNTLRSEMIHFDGATNTSMILIDDIWSYVKDNAQCKVIRNLCSKYELLLPIHYKIMI